MLCVGSGIMHQIQQSNIQHYTTIRNDKLDDALSEMFGISKSEFSWRKNKLKLLL